MCMSAPHFMPQAASYLARKDLDQARKDMATMNIQLKVGPSRL